MSKSIIKMKVNEIKLIYLSFVRAKYKKKFLTLEAPESNLATRESTPN